MSKQIKITLIGFLSTISLLLFQNCGNFESLGSASLVGGFSSKCGQRLLTDYENIVSRFVVNYRCDECHTSGGDGPAFADSSLQLAYNAFIKMGGTAKLEKKAISDHQAGYTGTMLRGPMDAVIMNWAAAEREHSECESGQ